jgi:Xaa-Pro aminopeptidase
MMTGLPIIPDAEYAARVKKAQELIRAKGLDALLVNSNEAEFASVRYFSNYWPIFEMTGVLIPAEGDPALIIGPESEAFAKDRSKIAKIHKMTEYREPADPAYPGVAVSSFNDVFADVGVPNPKKIGIAGYLVTTAPMLDGLNAAFPDAEMGRADEIMVALRSIKSEAEVACLRKAFEIAEIAIDEILKVIKPGMTELQVVGISQKVIYEHGAEYEGMPQYVFAGRSTRHAISRPTHNILKPGDIVQLNISARIDGYSSGVGVPICLGAMTDRMKELVEFGLETHLATINWLKAGVIASDVANQYKQMFIDRGYEKNFLYGPCHGLGMIEVEPPWMEETSDYPLAENMTFQADSFLYDDEFGLRWEDGGRITADGFDLFSGKFRGIIEVG